MTAHVLHVGNRIPCIAECIASQEPFWLPDCSRGPADAVLREQSRGGSFLLQSITVGKVPIGVFHADRAASERSLDRAAFGAFRQFCQQANPGFSYLRQR